MSEQTPDSISLMNEEEALRVGLQRLPTPRAGEEFNSRLIGALCSGSDMRPFVPQLLTRLRWMILPMLVGFALTFAAAYWNYQIAEQEVAIPKAGPQVTQPAPAPPLLPLPWDMKQGDIKQGTETEQSSGSTTGSARKESSHE